MNATRSFGVWVFIGVDTLFWGALMFLCSHARSGSEKWPDVREAAVAGVALPVIGVALVGAAWLSRKIPLTFVLLIASLVVWGVFWSRSAAAGLTPKAGRYGNIVYLTTTLYAAHVLGGLIAAGVRLGTGTPSPFLGRFLAFLTGVGGLIVLLFFAL